MNHGIYSINTHVCECTESLTDLSQNSSFNKSAYFRLRCHHIRSGTCHLPVAGSETSPAKKEVVSKINKTSQPSLEAASNNQCIFLSDDHRHELCLGLQSASFLRSATVTRRHSLVCSTHHVIQICSGPHTRIGAKRDK